MTKPPSNWNERESPPGPPSDSDDPAERTIRITPRADRTQTRAAQEAIGGDNRHPDASAGSERESPQPALRRSAGPRLSWPSRDAATGENRDAPRSKEYDGAGQREDLRSSRREVDQPPAISDSAPTRLYRPGPPDDGPRWHAGGGGTAGPSTPPTASQLVSDDPVVGWLVIIEGPGKGRSLELGTGANTVGRNATQKIALDFGDHEIHREKHAIVVFDPRSKRFFLQGSPDARNLTYLGDDLVLVPTELKGGETIIVGRTQLRFVPFCGPHFGWG